MNDWNRIFERRQYSSSSYANKQPLSGQSKKDIDPIDYQKEKIKKEDLDEEYLDGVTEFCNQFAGAYDSTFRHKLTQSVHVKQSL